MKRTFALGCVMTAMLVAAAGCSGQTNAHSDGDCSPHVRYQGVTYDNNTAVNQDAALGEVLGEGQALSCRGKPIETVEVRAVEGVDNSTGIGISKGHYAGVFASTDEPAGSWPKNLKAARQ